LKSGEFGKAARELCGPDSWRFQSRNDHLIDVPEQNIGQFEASGFH
jgi:hypothetical protein